MDEILLNIWHEHNRRFFDCALEPPREIAWQELSGEQGIGAHGIYLDKVKCIAIDERFRFDPEKTTTDSAEKGKVAIVYGLVLHEMVHQALHQQGEENFGKHGDAFIKEASRIAEIAGGITPKGHEEAVRWPLSTTSEA